MVGRITRGAQRGALFDAETVLLVGYDESEGTKFHTVGNERVRTDDNIYRAVGKSFAYSAFLSLTDRAGEQRDADPFG